MIAIYSTTQFLVLEKISSETDWGQLIPRISRTATLDGGSSISLYGYSDSDRTMNIIALDVPEVDVLALKNIVRASALVFLAVPEGLFEGAISRLQNYFSRVEFTFLIKSKIV